MQTLTCAHLNIFFVLDILFWLVNLVAYILWIQKQVGLRLNILKELQISYLLINLLNHLDLLLILGIGWRALTPPIPIKLLVNLRVQRPIPPILRIKWVLQRVKCNLVALHLGLLLQHRRCSRRGRRGGRRDVVLLAVALGLWGFGVNLVVVVVTLCEHLIAQMLILGRTLVFKGTVLSGLRLYTRISLVETLRALHVCRHIMTIILRQKRSLLSWHPVKSAILTRSALPPLKQMCLCLLRIHLLQKLFRIELRLPRPNPRPIIRCILLADKTQWFVTRILQLHPRKILLQSTLIIHGVIGVGRLLMLIVVHNTTLPPLRIHAHCSTASLLLLRRSHTAHIIKSWVVSSVFAEGNTHAACARCHRRLTRTNLILSIHIIICAESGVRRAQEAGLTLPLAAAAIVLLDLIARIACSSFRKWWLSCMIIWTLMLIVLPGRLLISRNMVFCLIMWVYLLWGWRAPPHLLLQNVILLPHLLLLHPILSSFL